MSYRGLKIFIIALITGVLVRIEPLASASAPNQPASITGKIDSHVNGLPVLHDDVDMASVNLWVFALFKRVSTLTFPISSPRYLSLSVLRI